MICAIHQPQYLPWLGYFHKMACSDVFVLLDDVQYKKNEWQNRNRIKTAQGEQYLTVPVRYRFPQKINEVTPDPLVRWSDTHAKSLAMNYSHAPFLNTYLPPFIELISRPWANLADLNSEVVIQLAGWLGITCRIVRSSQLPSTGASTERLVNLCRALEADTYLSGSGGRDYLDETLFANAKIKLQYQSFIHPVHQQVAFKDHKEFIPNLAALDLLFNCGPDSSRILRLT